MKNSRTLKKTAEIGFALTTMAILLSACGGGGGGVAPSTGTGFVTRGPVSGAAVWLDMDDTRSQTATDVNCGTTQADGSFVCTYPAPLTAASNTHMLIAVGGTDAFTNAPVTTPMLAPAGATQVSPLTNLVALQAASGVASGTPVSASAVATANTNVVTGLGLPVGTTLATTNSLNNPAILATETAISAAADQIVAAIAGATGVAADTLTASYAAAAQAVAAALSTGVPTNSTALVAVANTAAANAVTGSTPTLVANLAQLNSAIVANVNTISAAATSASAVQAAALIGQSTATNLATQVAAQSAVFSTGTAASAVAAATTVTDNVASAVAATAPLLNNVLPVAGTLVNGTAVNAGSVVVTGPLTTAVLNLGTAVGTPVYGSVTLDFSVTSTAAADARSFSGSISGLTVPAAGGALSATGATATVSGTHTNGTTATATANAAAIAAWVSGSVATAGNVTLDVGKILTDISASAGFAGLNLLKGNFNVVVSVNGIPLADQTGKLPLTSKAINVQVK